MVVKTRKDIKKKLEITGDFKFFFKDFKNIIFLH